MLNKSFKYLVALAVAVGFVSNLQAAIIGGVDFPDGEISFADAVVSFMPDNNGIGLLDRTQIPANALGIPDYQSSSTCQTFNSLDCEYVTLGDGGFLILEFVNNVLTTSGTNALDLWVFEVGSDVEDTFVDISPDGNIWISVGKVFGATSGIDIDNPLFDLMGFTEFRFVRLTDDPDEGQQRGAGPFVGADIDAVGAISTRFVDVSEPYSGILFVFALLTVYLRRNLNRN